MNDGHINASMDIDNASLDVTFGEVYEIDKGMPAAIIANLYSSQSTYSPGDYAIYRNRLYKCLVAIETPEEFDIEKWELVKVAEELKEKADKSTTYTKTETDALLDEKANANNVYTKTETDALLDEKANSDNVYTKAESDTLLDEKADRQSTLAALSSLSDAIATKADAAGTTAALALKADKSYVDTELDKKADKSSTYTKTEVDTALASKAAADSVYTKVETDEEISEAIEGKADTTYVNTELSKKADKTDTYTKTEVDTIADTKMDKSNPTGTGSLSINRKVNTTVGEQSVTIGYNSTASGEQSIAGGYSAIASNTVSVALGNAANASGFAATAFGTSTKATGNYSQAEGYQTRAGGGSSHAEGNQSYASGGVSHAEGYSTQAQGQYSHAEGNTSVASGSTSHAEGHGTTASGDYSHAEGRETIASAYSTHAEGLHTQATQNYSHSEGCSTIASGNTSHAEGYETTASGAHSHTEGYKTTANSTDSHAEGNNTTASSYSSHAEGSSTIASGDSSHAEGYGTTASGDYSHAEGSRTIANHKSQHVFGEYNVEDNSENEQSERGNYVEIVGNGYWDSDEEEVIHSNARTLDWNGNEVLAGDLTYNGNKSLTSEVQRLDGRVDTKANSSDVYTKTEMDSQLQSKANTSSVYTKTEVNTKLNTKANVNDVYTKTQVESRLSTKANTSDVYTKSQADNLLDAKADKETTYTKSEVDDIVYNILPDDTASGSIANFNTSLALPMEIVADVNAVQASGTPTPATPLPISGWSEISLTKCGKNLLNVLPLIDDNYYSLNSDGSLKVLQTDNRGWNSVSVITRLKKGTYTLSRSLASGYCDVRTSLNNYASGNIIGLSQTSKTFTLSDDADIKVKFGYGLQSGYPFDCFFNISVGSSASSFEPFNGNTEVINLGGTYYGGHFTQDKDGHRQFEVTHGIIDLGNMVWAYYTISPSYWFSNDLINTIKKTTVNTQIADITCECSPKASSYSIASGSTTIGIAIHTNGAIRLVYPDMPTTVEDLIADISGNKFVYPIAEPYVINLPDGEPIVTLAGTNNTFADTGDTSVVFKDSVNGYVEKKIASVQALALNT